MGGGEQSADIADAVPKSPKGSSARKGLKGAKAAGGDDGDDCPPGDSEVSDAGPGEGDDGEGDCGGDDTGPDADDDVEWEELYACPLTVRFTQEKIHPFFYRRGPIVNVVPKIRPVLHADSEDVELVPPFSPIHCLRKGDEMWALDNRRLYALQLAAMDQWPRRCRVRLLCCERLERRKLKTQWRKFQTTSEGRSVSVCARYQNFDAWSWFDRAVELEWYTLSQRFGALFSVFEVVPVLGALLFRTGLTGFESRAPLIIGFVMTFALDFLRQKVSVIEQRICELHIKAVMDGDVKQLSPCWRRLRQLVPGSGGEDDDLTMSAPQLAAMMALVLVLMLPYLLSVSREKLRSSLLSCWMGVACVLCVQLGFALRTNRSISSEFTGSGKRLSPKKVASRDREGHGQAAREPGAPRESRERTSSQGQGAPAETETRERAPSANEES